MQRSDKDLRNCAMQHAVYTEYHQRLAKRYQEKAQQGPNPYQYYHELAQLNEQLARQYEQLAEQYFLLINMPSFLLIKETP